MFGTSSCCDLLSIKFVAWISNNIAKRQQYQAVSCDLLSIKFVAWISNNILLHVNIFNQCCDLLSIKFVAWISNNFATIPLQHCTML